MTIFTDNWTPDKQRESNKKYYDNNRGTVAEKNKRWASQNLEKLREYSKEWKRKHPEQVAAKNELRNAIRRGVVARPNACSVCGAEGIKPDGHHPNYADPYSVVWVCRKCHRKTRKNNGQD